METKRQPDITIDYSYNRATGEIHLSVEYHSPEGRDPAKHEKNHREIVDELLTEAGLVGMGSCLVRVKRGQVITHFVVQADETKKKLTWTETDQVLVPEGGPSTAAGGTPQRDQDVVTDTANGGNDA
jgi:hypothetical protein